MRIPGFQNRRLSSRSGSEVELKISSISSLGVPVLTSPLEGDGGLLSVVTSFLSLTGCWPSFFPLPLTIVTSDFCCCCLPCGQSRTEEA